MTERKEYSPLTPGKIMSEAEKVEKEGKHERTNTETIVEKMKEDESILKRNESITPPKRLSPN